MSGVWLDPLDCFFLDRDILFLAYLFWEFLSFCCSTIIGNGNSLDGALNLDSLYSPEDRNSCCFVLAFITWDILRSNCFVYQMVLVWSLFLPAVSFLASATRALALSSVQEWRGLLTFAALPFRCLIDAWLYNDHVTIGSSVGRLESTAWQVGCKMYSGSLCYLMTICLPVRKMPSLMVKYLAHLAIWRVNPRGHWMVKGFVH